MVAAPMARSMHKCTEPELIQRCSWRIFLDIPGIFQNATTTFVDAPRIFLKVPGISQRIPKPKLPGYSRTRARIFLEDPVIFLEVRRIEDHRTILIRKRGDRKSMHRLTNELSRIALISETRRLRRFKIAEK
jgi:hypothetical protein